MKTEDLIRALAADGHRQPPRLEMVLGERLLPAVVIAIGIYFAALGLRPNLWAALAGDPRVFFKIGLMLLLVCLALPLTLRLSRPATKPDHRSLKLAIVPSLLLVGVLVELFTFPEADWGARLIGHNALFCLASIPLLGLAPLSALLLAMRQGAPSRPAVAGAAAGLLAGAIGATLYATHCPDDSPLFVAVWYSLGIGLVSVAGALLGSRFLRW